MKISSFLTHFSFVFLISNFDTDFDVVTPIEKPSTDKLPTVLTKPNNLQPAEKKRCVQKMAPEISNAVMRVQAGEVKVEKVVVKNQSVKAKADNCKSGTNHLNAAANPIDQVAVLVFYKFFQGTCMNFFVSICPTPDCPQKHFLPEVVAIRQELEKATSKEIDEVYGVCIKIPKMFEMYFSLFAEMFIKKIPNFESRLARMVMECEKNPRSHQKYFQVVEALVQFSQMQRYKAIRWLIVHHTDSTTAQEIILSMVVDLGADLIRLMDYLIKISNNKQLPKKLIEIIASNVTTYQDPTVPHFVLNHLFQKPPELLRQFDQTVLMNFLKFSKLQTELISADTEKLILLATKLAKLD